MRNLLIALTGFLVGAGIVVSLALALPRTMTTTVKQSSPQAAMPMSRTMSGGSMLSGNSMATYHPAMAKLTIQHVQKGCHVWSNGKMTTTMMRLALKPGGKLSILDQDVDAHQMLQFAGPMHLRMGGPMTMHRGLTLTFSKKGVYRLGTKTVEMPGGMGGMEVKTIGPDNNLRLVVTVA